MKTALYHQDPAVRSVVLNVLKENSDGTLNLGRVKGEVLVANVAVVDAPKVGACTVVSAEIEDPKKE